MTGRAEAVATDPLFRRALTALGAGCALVSLAFPYATIEAAGRRVSVAVALDPRSPLLVLGLLVLVGAALSMVDATRGEQVLGLLFAAVLVGAVLGPLVVVDSTGYPEPGIWLLLAGWVFVDLADGLDPAREHPRVGRWLPVAALVVTLLAGSAFLWVDRLAVTGGWTTARTAAWAGTGAVAVGAWITAAGWEYTV